MDESDVDRDARLVDGVNDGDGDGDVDSAQEIVSPAFQLAQRQAVAYERYTSVFMDGSAQLLVNGAAIGNDDVVLDLACGTGLVARYAAHAVGPAGVVVGADVNGAVLAVAGSAVDEDVTWAAASSAALPFRDSTFTHVICQQGLQFFGDQITAVCEARRVLRAGGTLTATVWATPGHNPYIETQLELLAVLDPSVAASAARATPPDADELLRSLATTAGFEAVDVTLLEHAVEIRDLPSWFLAQTSGTPWGPALAGCTEPERLEMTSELVTRMRAYDIGDGTHRVPFASYRLVAQASRRAAPTCRVGK